MNYYSLYKQFSSRDHDHQFSDIQSSALAKMTNYLIRNMGCPSFKEIRKECCLIKIKDETESLFSNNIYRITCEKLGVEDLEDSKGFSNNYPIVNNGAIVKRTQHSGTYYIYFQVSDEEDYFYDLEIFTYRYVNHVFIYEGYVRTKGISKYGLLNGVDIEFASIKKDFLETCSQAASQILSQQEITELEKYSSAITEEYLLNINNYVAAAFVTINYLKNNPTDLFDYLDNEIYCIHDIDKAFLSDNKAGQLSGSELFNNITNSENDFLIIDDHSLTKVLTLIMEQYTIKKIRIAVGYAYKSGMGVFKDIFKKIQANGGSASLIIGSLQHYASKEYRKQIDKYTVIMLNELIQHGLAELYTYTDSFYHGKLYYLESEDKVFVIIGSSNISHTAFSSNYELDILHIAKKGSNEDLKFQSAYNRLFVKCTKITALDESLFEKYNWNSELDAFTSLNSQKVSLDYVTSKINELTDEDQKYRLSLWTAYEPEIYENVGIPSLKDYFLLVYPSIQLAVFESYIPNNAYYVFNYRVSITNLLDELKKKKKMEMMSYDDLISRGYHFKDKDKLKSSIECLFQKLER